ncbi:hypothetical protein ACVWZL_004785 [Bradyrhizobium sp. GM2.4]
MIDRGTICRSRSKRKPWQVYYLPRPVSNAGLTVMRHLDRLHLEFPFAGSRMLRGVLAARDAGSAVGMSQRCCGGWG